MNILTMEDLAALFSQHQEIDPARPHEHYFHTRISSRLHHPWVDGTMENHILREGFSVTLLDIHVKEPFTFVAEYPGTQVAFTFCLEGAGWVQLPMMKEREAYCMDHRVIYWNPTAEGYHYHGPGRFRTVSIHIRRHKLMEMAAEKGEALPASLTRRLNDPNDFYFEKREVRDSLSVIAESLFDPAYTSISRQFFVESRTLELLASQLARLIPSHGQGQSTLSREDREKILSCHGLLMQRLTDPPSLIELARHAGINTFKLKTGFREIFGNSPYQLLKEERMQRAYQLLHAGHTPVQEAAEHTGYASVGSFSNAFYERFGIRPSEV
jgi:AraC-like DNA-binding protein